ncbi:MAG: tetratricopeptide repeat protein, partial [Bacteroidota bacterium]
MREEHKRKEEKELVRKYEAFLKSKENHYFDEESFIQIVSYYLTNEKYLQALKACDISLEQFPFSVDMTIEKADVLVKLNRPEEAIELLEYTLNVQPNDPELLIQKGSVHCVLQEFEQAITCYQSAVINVEEKDEIYFNIGMAHQGLGRYREAAEMYKKAIETNMLNEHALYELAYCLDVSGELESS